MQLHDPGLFIGRGVSRAIVGYTGVLPETASPSSSCVVGKGLLTDEMRARPGFVVIAPMLVCSRKNHARLAQVARVRNACDHASGARKQCLKVNTFEGWGVFLFF